MLCLLYIKLRRLYILIDQMRKVFSNSSTNIFIRYRDFKGATTLCAIRGDSRFFRQKNR